MPLPAGCRLLHGAARSKPSRQWPHQKPAAGATRDERKAGKQARAKQADRSRPLRVELKQADDRLARLAAEKAEVEALLAEARTAPEDIAELGRRLAHIAAETHLLEERWLVLHDQLDALDAAQ